MLQKKSLIKSIKGITVIELLVTISIMVLMLGLTLGMQRSSQRTLDLTAETLRILGTIQRAKSLTLALHAPLGNINNVFDNRGQGPKRICGYGIAFAPRPNENPREYIIYQKLSDATPRLECKEDLNDGRGPFHGYDENKDKLFLSTTLNAPFVDIDMPNSTLRDILFIPPEPAVIINSDNRINDGIIKIQTRDASRIDTIKVTRFGLIQLE